MVNKSFAMAITAATPGPLGEGFWVIRLCVDRPAFGRSILRDNARPELLPGTTHRGRVSGMERGHLNLGDGNSGVLVLLRASGSGVATPDVGDRGDSECCRHHW